MLQIHFSPSFDRIKSFANEYNKQFLQTKESNYTGTNSHQKKSIDPENKKKIKDLKKILRRSHIQLMEKLVICLAQQLNLDQKLYGPIQYSIAKDDLPWLRTNNCALATLLNWSNRTIQRQLSRLEESGFIEERTYHGTRSDYKLKLKSSLLHLIQDGVHILLSADNVPTTRVMGGKKTVNHSLITRKKRTNNGLKMSEKLVNNPLITRKKRANNGLKTGENPPQKPVFSIDGMTKFPLNDKNNHIKNNSLFTNGEIVDKSSISDLIKYLKGTTTRQRKSENPSSASENSFSLATKEQKKSPPRIAASPPQTDELSEKAQKYGHMLINFMYATIFSRQHFHAPSQINYTRRYLANELSDLSGRKLKDKFEELKIRIQLTWEWLERDPDRYVPIPSVYLNPENKKGFIRTKLWYHTFKDNKRNLKEANERTMEFYDRWNTLNKVLNRYLEDQNVDAYKRAKKYLQKKHPEISDAFDMMVLKSNKKFVA